jgi:addiction module HigA family antidote
LNGQPALPAQRMSKSSITIEGEAPMARTPIHPGELLADELEEIGVSSAGLARSLRVPPNRISQLLAGKRAITADTALRLARYFGTSADLWMNLQKTYELDLARKEAGKEINRIPQRKRARQTVADQAVHAAP